MGSSRQELAQRLAKIEAFTLRHFTNSRYGFVPQTAFWFVQHPQQVAVIGRVRRGTQVSDSVLNFAPVIELGAPHDPVGDALTRQHFLQGTRLGIGPVKHGKVVPRRAFLAQREQFSDDESGLVPVGISRIHHGLHALSGFGPETLFPPPLVFRDNRVRDRQNRAGRTVVLFQINRGGAGEIRLKFFDVADCGTTERINRLVRVPHHRQFGRWLGIARRAHREQANQLILRRVRILVFVH